MDLAKKIIKKRKNEASQNLYLSDIWVRNSVREARENSNIVISNWFSRKWREEFFDMSSSEMLRQTTKEGIQKMHAKKERDMQELAAIHDRRIAIYGKEQHARIELAQVRERKEAQEENPIMTSSVLDEEQDDVIDLLKNLKNTSEDDDEVQE